MAKLTLPSLREIDRELAQRSLAHFCRQAWRLVEPATELIWNWHLDAIAVHLEAVTAGQIQNLLINVPPGHMKSLMVSVFWPAWVWIRRPEWRAVFSSYAEDLAIRDSVKTRLIVESPWYREEFVRGRWSLAGDQNVKSYYATTRQGFRIATGIGGKGTGLRGNAIVVDDPLKATDAFSKPARDQVIRWWDQEMANRVADPRTGTRVVIMQRLHEEDLSGHLLKAGGWQHLCLPSRFEEKRRTVTHVRPVTPKKGLSSAQLSGPDELVRFWQDPRQAEGELLFEAMFPADVIAAEERRLGSIGFPGQHQQRPTAAEGGMFQRAWWRFWRFPWQEVRPAWATALPGFEDIEARTLVLDGEKITAGPGLLEPIPIEETALSWDMTFKDSKSSDYVAGGVWSKAKALRILRDLYWKRAAFPETLRAFREQAEKWPQATAKLIEDKANGPAVISVCKNEIPGIIEIEPEGGKQSRAAATSPTVEAGNVLLPLHAEWTGRYIEEHANFPLGAHDDAVDQQSQMLNRWNMPIPHQGVLDYYRAAAARQKAADEERRKAAAR